MPKGDASHPPAGHPSYTLVVNGGGRRGMISPRITHSSGGRSAAEEDGGEVPPCTPVCFTWYQCGSWACGSCAARGRRFRRLAMAFAVGMLCRAMSKPTKELFQDSLRVLSYLHRTRHTGLRYQANAKARAILTGAYATPPPDGNSLTLRQ